MLGTSHYPAVQETPLHPRHDQSCPTEEFRHLSISESPVYKTVYKDFPVRNFNPEHFKRQKNGLSQQTYQLLYTRTIFEKGQPVKKNAQSCEIYLKDGPPEGCDKQSFYLEFMGKVSSNPTEAFKMSSKLDDTLLFTVLTEDEYAKLSGMDEVKSAKQIYEDVTFF